MRVLHVISGLDAPVGGPAVALWGLSEAQARQGLDVSIAASWVPGTDLAVADRLGGRGVKVHTVGPCRDFLCWSAQIRPFLRKLVPQFDILHIHGVWEEIHHQACRAAQKSGVPYIIRPCGMLDEWSYGNRIWSKRVYMLVRMRRNLDRAAAMHYLSEAESDSVARLNLRPQAIVEPNGIDLAEFEQLPPRGTFRSKHPVLGERPYIVFLGRIHKGKGLELLIPAMARLQRRDVMAVVVGPDNEGYLSQMQQLARRKGVDDRILWTGLMRGADRLAALVDAELFCLPSFHENFGVAVIEALAAGLPAIVSDHVSACSHIRAGQVGGVARLDADDLARELDRWLADDRLRKGAAERARPFAFENFNWTRIAGRWTEHYRRLIGT